MTTGQKIAQQRKKRALTQGALAEELGVTRQAVSKWEADAALPDADKLVRLSELFGCTVDYLLKNREEDPAPSPSGGDPEGEKAGQTGGAGSLFWFPLRTFEYKSGRTLFGLPLVHVNLGWGKTAKGIVAVGFKAHGVLSVGLLSMGVFSFGVLSLGALSVGAAALGVLSIGAIAVALFLALGAAAAGFLAYGAVAVGFFSAGALAVAQYVAVGDHAIAAVPIARTYASGGELCNFFFLYASPSAAAQVGVWEGGRLVPAGELLSRATEECVPRFLRGIADMFAGYRIY